MLGKGLIHSLACWLAPGPRSPRLLLAVLGAVAVEGILGQGRRMVAEVPVMHHVSHILAKIGAANRRDAAAWAVDHGIA